MSGLRSAPTVYSIDPGISFVDALVAGLLDGEALGLERDDPLALSRVTVLLPTRRACRALRDAFLRGSGARATILPRIRPLGDLDDDETGFGDLGLAEGEDLPPAIAPLRRQLLLTRLILAWDRAQEGSAGDDKARTVDQAARLASELAHLLDQAQTERLDLGELKHLAPERYATHWQQVLDFLAIVIEHWPRILAEEGLVDIAPRRNAVLERIAQRWREAPPTDPVIAAGSTGSLPATAELLSVVARLPKGCVVLPGLDRAADDETWAALDASHPQNGLKQLLARLSTDRREVADWPAPGLSAGNRARVRLIAEALRPAETTTRWPELEPVAPEAIEGLLRIDCANPQEEAGVIALLLRRQLEQTGATGALVTADRALARRVAAELGRWGVEIDDSAGLPLAQTPPGVFLRLTATLVVERAAPIALLAALKHPLAAGGKAEAAFRQQVRRLEQAVLRGPRPGSGIAGLKQALGESAKPLLEAWLDRLEAALAPLAALMERREATLSELLAAHVSLAEWLAASDEQSGPARLWAGEAGETAAEFVAALSEGAEPMAPVAPWDYPALLDALMDGTVVRPRYGRHSRLFIWGPLEARLQHAELMILGGLNEGSWPPEPDVDPWMSRPMRAEFGLPPDERRIGLSAHDFAQSCAAPTVVLTRATRVDGTPTVPSRWLTRIDALLEHADLARAIRRDADQWLHWRELLDGLDGERTRIEPPEPRPPIAARPRKLSVTRIEQWMADPYAIYARYVLGLEPLDPIDADPGAAERGTIIHHILDQFVQLYRDALPEDACERLIEMGRAAFGPSETRPSVFAFWWPRFERIAAWFIEAERARRESATTLATECQGALDLKGPAGDFVLTAKADRIDRLADGGLAIIDYKTGGTPDAKEVRTGKRPQLPLEAAIALAGGFSEIPGEAVRELAFWRLTGGDPPGETKPIHDDLEALATAARAGLEKLIAHFDDPATPYLPVPRPSWKLPWNDYAHLARIQEWASAGAEQGE